MVQKHDPHAPLPPEIEAKVQELLKRPYRKVVRINADDGYLAEVPELPGCMTDGETEAEAMANLPEAMAGWLSVALLDGFPIPEPQPEPEHSGRLLLRMPRSLPDRLAARAETEGVSLNLLAVTLLAQGLAR